MGLYLSDYKFVKICHAIKDMKPNYKNENWGKFEAMRTQCEKACSLYYFNMLTDFYLIKDELTNSQAFSHVASDYLSE